MIFYREAITKLVPEGTIFETIFDENGWRIGRWGSPNVTKPTEKEINDKIAELEKQFADNEYQRKRLEEYPSIQECIHAILDDDLTALQSKRKLIKDKFPKPE